MRKRHIILVAVLIGIIVWCATTAFLLWRQRQAAALTAASVPEIPDLSHWPQALSSEIRDATAKARSGSYPVEPLGHLAELYLGNSYVSQAKPPLTALCRLQPSNAKWRYLLADAHMRSGETNAAEADFQKTAELDPKSAMAWIRLGLLRSQRGAVAAARECYANAAAIDTNNLMPAFLLIEFETRNRGGADVRRRLEDFSRAHPDFKDPFQLMAVLDAAVGDEVAAAKERRLASAASRQLVNEDPWLDHLAQFCFDADHLRELSQDAFGQGRFEAAENLLKRAIQIAPKDPALRDALYSVYEKMSRPADALQTLQQAVNECPDDPNLRVQLSRLLCTLNRPDEAIASLQPALQRWPTNAKLHAALGFALNNAGKNEQAVAELQEAIRLDFSLVEERYNLAVALVALGQRDAARAAAQKTLEMRPDYADPMVLLSVLALEDGDLAATESTVNRLYTLKPEDSKSQSLYCRLQLMKGMKAEQAGKPDEAEKSYRTGLAVVPTYWRLLRAEGMLSARSGHFLEAVESFRGYVQNQPQETEAYFMLGETLRKAGRVDDGRQVLQQGLALEQQNGTNLNKIEAFKRALEQ